MIELVTGIPTSGKSYFAASKMFEIYNAKNRLIYTNVNLRIPYDDYIQALNVSDLYDFAASELELFKKFTKLSNDYKKRIDEDIYSLNEEKLSNDEFSKYYGNYDEYLKDSGILKSYGGSYIFWDECHNDLDGSNSMNKADPVWIRFFSYHRHFDIDIMLITQDILLVHRKYRPFIAKYYFGQNPAKRLSSKTLKFKVYTDYREFEKFFVETLQIPMKKEIYEFYDSGEYNPDKSLIFKKLLPIFLIVIAIFTMLFLFYNHLDEPSKKVQKTTISKVVDKNITSSYKQDSKQNFDDDIIDSSFHIVYFMCNLRTCTLKNSSFTLPLDSMESFSKYTESKILFSSSINRYYKLVAVSISDSLFNNLMIYNFNLKGDKHENNKIDFSSPVSHIN